MKLRLFLILLKLHIALIWAVVISPYEFNTAVTANGFRQPPADIYQRLTNCINAFSRKEVAMFLAHLIYESDGFKTTDEIECSPNRCRDRYKDEIGLATKSYHGRGYIKLIGGLNYKKVSKALGMGDRLLHEPGFVSQDKKIAIQVSVWLWKTKVRPLLDEHGHDFFGWTTMGINEDECLYYTDRAMKRWKIYIKVAETL